MASTGGSIRNVMIGNRIFTVTADASSKRKLGGSKNEILPNGDGSSRVKQMVESWELNELVLSCDDAQGTQEFLQNIANRGVFVPIAISYASGERYQGSGIPVDEIMYDSENSTVSLSLRGTGTLTRQ